MSRHSIYYRLEGHTPVLCTSMEWSAAFENTEGRRVAATDLPGDVLVSTVFLGIDHSFGDGGPPVLFETMVLGHADPDEYQERCSTWDEALVMHETAVAWAKERLAPPAINDPGVHSVISKL